MSTDRDALDDYRTWVFEGEEGGAIGVTASAAHLTIQRTSGPDCDGTRSDVTYMFVQRTPGSQWSNGTHVRPDMRSTDTDVWSDNPRMAWHDYLTAELGHHLASRWLTDQPEPLH
jgi:hypothetical protein